MAHWLFKTEPNDYSFERLQKEKRARWDGVTNPVALKNLRAVRKGDEIFIYHTGDVKAVVGIARAVEDATQDKEATVEIAPERALAKAVTLAAVKADPAFKDFALVRIGRLSVMQVPDELWERMLAMEKPSTGLP